MTKCEKLERAMRMAYPHVRDQVAALAKIRQVKKDHQKP